MNKAKLAIIGFGNVGQGLVKILKERGDFLAEHLNVQFSVVAVCDMRLGSVYDPAGLPLGELLSAAQEGDLTSLAASDSSRSVEETITQIDFDTLVEASFTDLQTGEPAVSYVRQALRAGKHVATTNKGPIALHLPEILKLAQQNNVRIGFEGTVMSGTPALAIGKNFLTGAVVTKIQGILNGTTNYILTQMENGNSYAEALAEAQELGFAEADPTGDVEGYDSAGKVVILSNLLMGTNFTMADINREGITKLTVADINQAKAENFRWKLIGTIEMNDTEVIASVRPTKVPLEHSLATVSGATNAITYSTELLGEVTLVGPGAGRVETGYALINDLLAIHG
jgi:homoserine dehydrogenase